jgi:selenobiotic family peptide radical SAM maturase
MLRDALGRETDVFTLQWHLTNACAGRCAHCYDRTSRDVLPLDAACAVLSDFVRFCWQRGVVGRISLTGGDPILYPGFWELYSAIAEAGLGVAILGNPIGAREIARLLAVQRPLYFQVSLEGRREQDDRARGEGHFDRTLTFLAEARRLGLATHVMLTLTRANLPEVLPLAEELRGRTDRLAFNRLAQVGEAQGIAAPTPAEYGLFLERYLIARRLNPILGLKDNLINAALARVAEHPFPGCTGHGCGAGFDFLALLPDGEVHACRKFPSLIGRVQATTLASLYDSPSAAHYRSGSRACRACRLRTRCGGCPAVTFGRGLDPLVDRDPDCLYEMGDWRSSLAPLPFWPYNAQGVQIRG